VDLDTYTRKATGKHCTETKSKPKNERGDSTKSIVTQADFQVWIEARKQASCKPRHLAQPLKPIRPALSRSNVEFHQYASCSTSTAASGLTSCSASSVDVSELDVKEHPTTLDREKMARSPKIYISFALQCVQLY